MSAAAATDATPLPAKGKKKLIVLIAAALLVVLLGGGAAFVLLKKKPVEDDESEEAADAKPVKTAKAPAHDPKAVPSFVPLDLFTVNLADRDSERFAQVGMTLEIADAKVADQIRSFMPAIRNNILMAIADKTAAQLMERDGKKKLAHEVRRETSRAMGYDVPDEEEDEAIDPDAPKKGRKKKARKAPPELPIRAVHFSNFIIQ